MITRAPQWALGFLAALASLFFAAWAHAQPAPSVLEEMKLITEDANQAAFLLRFSPDEPKYQPLEGDVRRPALLMTETLRAPRVELRRSFKGLVESVYLDTSDGNLILRFETARPARITVEPMADNVFQVSIRLDAEGAAGAVVETASSVSAAPSEAAAARVPDFPEGFDPGDHYELIFLKYADVGEVIGLLMEGVEVQPNNVFIRREPGFGSPGSSSQPSYNYGNSAANSDRESRPFGQSFGKGLAIDRRLNAVWASGTPEKIARVRDQIALIDVPVDSVILETQFVELTEQGARNLGIDLNNNNGQIAIGTLRKGEFLPFGVDPEQSLPSGVMQAAIYAQIEKGEGRILSRPRIAAQSGSTAKIITGDALPILTSITLSGVNGVSQQVQYVNVGVTLQIAPRVSADGFVTSQIYGVVSSVTGFSQGYPTISQREAETSASVRDGDTFVIGGLTQENLLTSTSKLPLLGDLPLIGRAFQVERSTRSTTELYIIITPHIVRHAQSPAPAAR